MNINGPGAGPGCGESMKGNGPGAGPGAGPGKGAVKAFQAPKGWKLAQGGGTGIGGNVVATMITIWQPLSCANWSGRSKMKEPNPLIVLTSMTGVFGSIITDAPTAKPIFASTSIAIAPAGVPAIEKVLPGVTRAQNF